MTLYHKFLTGIIKLGLTEEEIKKWQYCGGDYASHRNYFKLRFLKKKFPEHVQWCVCSHKIEKMLIFVMKLETIIPLYLLEVAVSDIL
jgi:hypothetical protein